MGHLEQPPTSSTVIVGAVLWPGVVGFGAKADGYRLSVRCAWPAMWLMGSHRHALAQSHCTGRIYLERPCNVGPVTVQTEVLIGLDINMLCRKRLLVLSIQV